MYPIQDFILKRMSELNLTRSEVIRKIGYQNVSKGCVKFDLFMNENNFNQFISENLYKALETSPSVIKEKITETLNIIEIELEEKRKKAYFPHLYAHTTNRIPSPIFICAMGGFDRFKIIPLPNDFNNLSETEQTDIIKEKINISLSKYEGNIPTFGKIEHYVLSRYYEENAQDRIAYDLEGNIIEPSVDQKEIINSKATLCVGGKSISGLLQQK